MTVVVAYRDQDAGVVYLAADSASCGGHDIIRPAGKINRLPCGDSYALFAASGYSAFRALVKAHLKLSDAPGPTDMDEWAQATAEAITAIGLEHGLGTNGMLDDNDGLLAYGSGLWHVSHHLAIPIDTYTAIGSGSACAIGAMWASCKTLPPADVARAGVAAAIDHMDGIVVPITGMATVALA